MSITNFPGLAAQFDIVNVKNMTGATSTAGYWVCWGTQGDGYSVMKPATALLGAPAGVFEKSGVADGSWTQIVVKGAAVPAYIFGSSGDASIAQYGAIKLVDAQWYAIGDSAGAGLGKGFMAAAKAYSGANTLGVAKINL